MLWAQVAIAVDDPPIRDPAGHHRREPVKRVR